MPSAFNDDVQFGLQVSRPTILYALKALQLREKVFQWIARRAFFWPGSIGFPSWFRNISKYQWIWHRIRTRSIFLILFSSIILSRNRAKASQKQRFAETADGADIPSTGSSGSSVFASLSQWYDHARTVWQTLSMCGTDLLQFRTMRRAGSYGKSMEKLFVYVTTREALGECYSCG